MLEMINKSNSNAATPWATYQIPVLVYEALSNWQAPYSTADIMLCIKTVLNIDFNNPEVSSAETYRKVNSIRTFIHSLEFKNPQQWQKKYLLSQFFGNEIEVVKRSQAFKALDKDLEELLKQLTPVCHSSFVNNNWLASGKTYAFNTIEQLFNLITEVKTAPNFMFKFFVFTQLLLYFAQGVNGQPGDSNTTALELQQPSANFDTATPNHNFVQLVDDAAFHITDNFAATYDNDIPHGAEQKTALSDEALAALIKQANILLDSREFDEALKVAEQITSSNVNHPEAYFIKGSIALEKDHNYAQAVKYYGKACKLAPNNAKYQLFYKSAQYFNAPENTLAHYRTKTAFDPLALSAKRFAPNENLFCMAGENTFIARSCHTTFNKQQTNKLFKKAEHQHEQGNLTEALQHYEEVLAIIPHNNPFYNSQLQYLYWQKSLIHFSLLQYEQAKLALESVMVVCTKPSMLVDVYFQYGSTLLNLFYQSIKNSSPDAAILERAAASYQKASQLDPNNQVLIAMHEETRALLGSTRANMEQRRYRM